MLHIAEPIIILSSLLQPSTHMPQKPSDYYVYETSQTEPLPFQHVNDVITSDEMLYHILEERGIYDIYQEEEVKK